MQGKGAQIAPVPIKAVVGGGGAGAHDIKDFVNQGQTVLGDKSFGGGNGHGAFAPFFGSEGVALFPGDLNQGGGAIGE